MTMKKFFALITLYISCSAVASTQPLLIITHAYLRPDFIEIQHKTFKKFLKDPYEFVVFNDARDYEIRSQIKQLCKKLQLRCIEIPQEIHDRPYLQRYPYEDPNNACARCANVVQYSLDVLGFQHDGLVAIIDSDMFLVQDFSIAEYMQNYDIAGVPQSRGNVLYLWNGLVFFNMNSLPNKKSINFNCGVIEGNPTDVGGHLYYYFKQNPDVRVSQMGVYHSQSFACNTCQQKDVYTPCAHNTDHLRKQNIPETIIKFMQSGPPNIEFLLNNNFLHYRGGGNWDHKSQSYHDYKTKILLRFIDSII